MRKEGDIQSPTQRWRIFQFAVHCPILWKCRVSKAISIYPAEASECSRPGFYCKSTSSATTRWIPWIGIGLRNPELRRFRFYSFIHPPVHPSVTLHPSPPRRDLLICTHRVLNSLYPCSMLKQTETHTLRVNTIDWKEFSGFNKGIEFEWSPLYGLVWSGGCAVWPESGSHAPAL